MSHVSWSLVKGGAAKRRRERPAAAENIFDRMDREAGERQAAAPADAASETGLEVSGEEHRAGEEGSVDIDARRARERAGHAEAADRAWKAAVGAIETSAWDDALDALDDAGRYAPTRREIFELRAQVLLEMDELVDDEPLTAARHRHVHQAVVAAERAVACDGTWAVAHQTLGRARLVRGDVAAGVEALATAVRLQPGDAALRQELDAAEDVLRKLSHEPATP